MKIKTDISILFRAFILGLLLLNFSCKSTDGLASSKASVDMAQLETMLNDQNYRIAIGVVYPLNSIATAQALNNAMITNTGSASNRIDVHGDNYFIEFKDGKAKGYLPYFGEQRVSSPRFGVAKMGISFEDMPRDYSIRKHKKKDAYIVEFVIDDKNDTSEAYDVNLTVFANSNVNVDIAPTLKQMIRYSGNLKAVEASRP